MPYRSQAPRICDRIAIVFVVSSVLTTGALAQQLFARVQDDAPSAAVSAGVHASVGQSARAIAHPQDLKMPGSVEAGAGLTAGVTSHKSALLQEANILSQTTPSSQIWIGSELNSAMNAPLSSPVSLPGSALLIVRTKAVASQSTRGTPKGQFPDSTRMPYWPSPPENASTLHFFSVGSPSWFPDFSSTDHLVPSYLVSTKVIGVGSGQIPRLQSHFTEGLREDISSGLNTDFGLETTPAGIQDPFASGTGNISVLNTTGE